MITIYLAIASDLYMFQTLVFQGDHLAILSQPIAPELGWLARPTATPSTRRQTPLTTVPYDQQLEEMVVLSRHPLHRPSWNLAVCSLCVGSTSH